jgi:hypothetical protein
VAEIGFGHPTFSALPFDAIRPNPKVPEDSFGEQAWLSRQPLTLLDL